MSNAATPGGPGIRSTEFLGFVITVLVVVLDSTMYFDIKQEYIYAIFATATGYGGARTFLKSRPTSKAVVAAVAEQLKGQGNAKPSNE